MSYYNTLHTEQLVRMCQRRRLTLPAVQDKNTLIKILKEGDIGRRKIAKQSRPKASKRGQASGDMGQRQSTRAREDEEDTKVDVIDSPVPAQDDVSALPAPASCKEESVAASDIPAMESSIFEGSSKHFRTPDEDLNGHFPGRKRSKKATKFESHHKIEHEVGRKDEEMTMNASADEEQDEISITTNQPGFTTITDTAGIVRLTNDVSSIRTTLSNQFYIVIPTEDIEVKPRRYRKIRKFFKTYSPTGVHTSLTEWFITFGQDEKGATACFEHFMVEKYTEKNFRMELVGRNGEVLRRCKREVLEPEDDFDREWVAFELLRRLDAYVVD